MRRSCWLLLYALGTAQAWSGEASKSPLPGVPPGEDAVHATKFEAAIRLGFSFPFGTVTSYVNYFDFTALDEMTKFTVPLSAEVGVRVAGVVFVGAYFQYAPGVPNSTTGGSSSSDVRLGAEVLLHPLGIAPVDVWVGVGAGYEWFNVSPLAADNSYAQAQFRGWELLNVQAGVDFALGSGLRLGPYVAFSIGQFDAFSGERGPTTDTLSQPDTPLHYWLTFGVRLAILP